MYKDAKQFPRKPVCLERRTRKNEEEKEKQNKVRRTEARKGGKKDLKEEG